MKEKKKTLLTGLVTGFANGLFGAGGGTLLVPALEKFFDVKAQKAHATTIAVILPLSVLSSFIYLRGGDIDWKITLYISIGGVIGGVIGAKFLSKISGKWLHRIFGFFMIAAAVRMIFPGS